MIAPCTQQQTQTHLPQNIFGIPSQMTHQPQTMPPQVHTAPHDMPHQMPHLAAQHAPSPTMPPTRDSEALLQTMPASQTLELTSNTNQSEQDTGVPSTPLSDTILHASPDLGAAAGNIKQITGALPDLSDHLNKPEVIQDAPLSFTFQPSEGSDTATFEPALSYGSPSGETTLTVWFAVMMVLLACVPVIGLICAVVWGLKSHDIGKRTLGRALVIVHLLALLGAIAWFLVGIVSNPVAMIHF